MESDEEIEIIYSKTSDPSADSRITKVSSTPEPPKNVSILFFLQFVLLLYLCKKIFPAILKCGQGCIQGEGLQDPSPWKFFQLKNGNKNF